jgi:amidohydrolase
MSVFEEVEPVLLPMLELYLDLHRHPELSGQEVRTASRVGSALERAGFAVTGGVGGHGVVGVLRNGDGPVVLLRAELDALPVREQTGRPYANPGPVMHACGHDLHLAALCGVASLLDRSRDGWRGTVIAVGQPAEETLSGAAAMLADGLYARFGPPDLALAQHIGPFPAGWVAHMASTVTAGSVELAVTVPGRAGNAGQPDAAVNPIPIAARIVARLVERFPGRPYGPSQVYLTIGAIQAGERANVIADHAILRLTLRSHDPSALRVAASSVMRVVAVVCATASVVVTAQSPVGINDPGVAPRVRAAHESLFGRNRVLLIPPSLSTEDFPLFAVPTAYWSVGSVAPRVWAQAPGTTLDEKLTSIPVNHSPLFAPDPAPTLRTAMAALLAGARSQLKETQP